MRAADTHAKLTAFFRCVFSFFVLDAIHPPIPYVFFSHIPFLEVVPGARKTRPTKTTIPSVLERSLEGISKQTSTHARANTTHRYKLFIKYPQGLRLTFDRIKERLEDSDSSVVSCAVNVICELADKNPKNYLAMAPQFFRLLTTSSNNWMLIKVCVWGQ